MGKARAFLSLGGIYLLICVTDTTSLLLSLKSIFELGKMAHGLEFLT
jgi:hypothetical protein